MAGNGQAFIDAFSFIGDNHAYVINRMVSHLEISGIAVAFALVIGVPIGILLGHIHRWSFFAINVSNFGRALPSVAILSIFLPIFGLDETNVVFALFILAFPPMLTNAYVAIDQVDVETVDAARGIGLTPWQVLLRVELPLGLPLIFAGIRTGAVFVVATATLSGFFGGGGLGDIISDEPSFELKGVLGASYVLIALAFVVQIVFLAIERLVTPAGLKVQSRNFRQSAQTQVLLNEDGGSVAEPNKTDRIDSEASVGA